MKPGCLDDGRALRAGRRAAAPGRRRLLLVIRWADVAGVPRPAPGGPHDLDRGRPL